VCQADSRCRLRDRNSAEQPRRRDRTRDELLGGNHCTLSELLLDARASAIAQRSRQAPLAAGNAEIVRLDGDEIELALDEPVSAITPGSRCVLRW